MEGYYSIKKPRGKRRSFAIQRKWTEGGKIKSRSLRIAELTIVNRNMLRGLLTEAEALEQVQQICALLYKERDQNKLTPLFTDENLKVLEAYWKDEYLDRDLETPDNMYYDLKRAIGYLQGLSIHTATREEIRDQYRTALEDNPSRHRRMIDRLNQLLRYVGRDFRLKKPRAEQADVTFLTVPQFRQFISTIKDPLERALYWTAFATGLRLGECFSLRPEMLDGDLVRVNKQMLKKKDGYREKLPKRGKRRTTMVVHEEAIPFIKTWASVPMEEKKRIREKDWAGKVFSISAELFPDPVNQITFHGFRHSYAIHMLQNGVPLDAVALNLGNTRAVCEKYYTGFVIREPGIDMVRRILKQAGKE